LTDFHVVVDDTSRTTLLAQYQVLTQIHVQLLGLIFRNVISCKRYRGKATAIPVQAWAGPLDSRWFRLPEFLDIGT